MAKKPKILAFAGSLRKHSYNKRVLKTAIRGAENAGAEVTYIDLRDYPMPVYNADDQENNGFPENAIRFQEILNAHDGLLICSPEYNGSLPGGLKNAIDWASRPYGDSAWNGKPVAIMGASIGAIATARAQYHLRQMMVFLNMFPVNQPEVMIGNAGEKFDEQGNLTDETTKDFIRQLLQNLVGWTRRIGQPQKSE